MRRSALLLMAAMGAAHAADDCKALNGTYAYQSVAPRNGMPEYLSNFAQGKDKDKLYRRETAGGPTTLSASGTMARPKVTHLAATATLTHDARGTRLKFTDAQGKDLAEMGIDSPLWKCARGALARTSQRTSGLGDVMRNDKVEETLARDGASGELVYTETVTPVAPPGGKPRKSEARFTRR